MKIFKCRFADLIYTQSKYSYLCNYLWCDQGRTPNVLRWLWKAALCCYHEHQLLYLENYQLNALEQRGALSSNLSRYIGCFRFGTIDEINNINVDKLTFIYNNIATICIWMTLKYPQNTTNIIIPVCSSHPSQIP